MKLIKLKYIKGDYWLVNESQTSERNKHNSENFGTKFLSSRQTRCYDCSICDSIICSRCIPRKNSVFSNATMIAQKRTNERTNKRNSYQFAFLLAVFVINKNESQCEQPLAQHNPKNTKLRRTMSNKRPLLGPSASDGVSKAERKRMKLAMMRLISDESKQFDDNELTNRESRVDGAKRPKSARELAALQAIQSANAATSSQQPHNHTSSTSTTVVEPPTSAAATESKKPRHRRQRGFFKKNLSI